MSGGSNASYCAVEPSNGETYVPEGRSDEPKFVSEVAMRTLPRPRQ